MRMFGNDEFRRHPLAQLVSNSRRPPGVKRLPGVTLVKRGVKVIK